MKRKAVAVMTGALLAASLSGPALAKNITVKFSRSDGTITIATFDTAIGPDDGPAPYTFNPETNTLCSVDEEGEHCATFAEFPDSPPVGFKANYETSRGFAGMAEIMWVED